MQLSDLSNVTFSSPTVERLAVVIGILHPLLPVQPIRLRSPARLLLQVRSQIPRQPLQRRISDGSNRYSITSTAGGTAVADADLTLLNTDDHGYDYDGEHVTFKFKWEYGPDAAQAVVVSDASLVIIECDV